MSEEQNTVENPDVGMPAVINPPARAIEAKTKIKGKALVPDLSQHSNAGVVREYVYWVGVHPKCPVESLDVAGINFPKVNEKLVKDPLRTNIKRRVPVVGALVRLTEDKIIRMRERLPRTVLRMLTNDAGAKEEPGTGENVGDVHQRPSKGYPITIPTPEEVASRRKRGKATREYSPQANDVPAARFMFAQLCPDQDHPERGEYYPRPLEETGLDWPDEILTTEDDTGLFD